MPAASSADLICTHNPVILREGGGSIGWNGCINIISRHPPRRRGIHVAERLWQVVPGCWISACAEMTAERWRG